MAFKVQVLFELTIVNYRTESPQQPQVFSLPLEAGLGSSLEVAKQQSPDLGNWKQNTSSGNGARASGGSH